MNKSIINTAVAAALIGSSTMAGAAINTFTWDGIFTMLDPVGAALANTSLPGGTARVPLNQFQTSVNGTMAFDDATGAGTATLVPFEFFNGNPTLPAEAIGINMQSIGDGAGGPGTLVLGNMLFNWNTSAGIPVSIVMDASGFFTASAAMFAGGLDGSDLQTTNPLAAGYGAIPASDGTTTLNLAINGGYLNLGPIPMATTSYNTTNAIGCGGNDTTCSGNGASGRLPLVSEAGVANPNDFDLTTPTYSDLANDGIGGSPFQDGPFPLFNPNFDVTSMVGAALVAGDNAPIGYTTPTAIGPFDVSAQTSAVPVPAAVWLFGSGLLGLVGVARRKKS